MKKSGFPITIVDQWPRQKPLERPELLVPAACLPLSEVLRLRIERDVAHFNRNNDPHFAGLVRPGGTSLTRSGFLMKRKRDLDAARHFALVESAFHRLRLFVSWNEVRVDNLSTELDCRNNPLMLVSMLDLVEESKAK